MGACLKYITNDDFCEVVGDNLANDGLPKGTRVYIIGSRALPVSEKDPYTQRVKFFAHIVNTKTMEFDPRMFLLDPNSITQVGKNEQKKLSKRLQEYIDAMEQLPEAV